MRARSLSNTWTRQPHPALVAGLLAAAVAAASLHNGFALDDVYMIAENARVHSLDAPWRFLAESYWPPDKGAALYRPLTVFGFALQWWLGGGSPLLFHLVSLVLVAGVSALVATLALALDMGRGAALVAGGLFAVHPVHVEAVANVVGQGELLAALAVLSAALVYVRGRRHGALAPATSLALVMLYGLGCLAKENAAVLPALLLAAEFLGLPDQSPRARLQAVTPALIGMATVAVIFWTVRSMVVGGVVGVDIHPVFRGASPVERLLTSLGSVPTWTRLLLFPAHLRADYSPAEFGLAHRFGPDQLAGSVILLLLGTLVWRTWRTRPVVALGVVFAGLTLAPVSNVFLPTGIIIAERALFLPSAGVVLAGAAALEPLLLGRWARWGAAGVAVLMVLGAARSMLRAPAWMNTEVVAQHLRDDAPRDYRSWWMIGGFALKRGEEAEGLAAYRRAAELYDGDPNMLVDVANTELVHGHYAEAERLYRRAVQLVPGYRAARSRLILALVGLGRCREAAAEAHEAARFGDTQWRRRLAFVDSVAASPGSHCDVTVGLPPP
jgi:protein O-mannosyl-transferase